MFENGLTLDRYFQTRAGVIWVSASVTFVGRRLMLTDLLVYPTTGSKLEVGLHDMLEIFSLLEVQARLQGFEEYTVEAERVYPDKPRVQFPLAGGCVEKLSGSPNPRRHRHEHPQAGGVRSQPGRSHPEDA